MSPENLIQWIKEPAQLDRDSLVQLKALLEEYPCFSAARTLYLKNLLNLHDLRFSKELIRTAISVPDRRRLYYFVEDKPMPEPSFLREKELSNGEGFSIIDRFLHETATLSADADPLFSNDPDIEGNQDDSEVMVQDSRLPDPVPSPEEESFTLDYVSYLNQSSSSTLDTPVESMKGQNLIDAFLADPSEHEKLHQVTMGQGNQHPQGTSDVSSTDDAVPLVDMPEETFTETLAKIYLKQKRYDHALEIFKSLSLKYPEKNVYFADQIRYLEKLIINIKNN